MSITGDNKVAVAFVVVGLVPPVASEWGSIGSPGRVRDDNPDGRAAIVAAATQERSRRQRGRSRHDADIGSAAMGWDRAVGSP